MSSKSATYRDPFKPAAPQRRKTGTRAKLAKAKRLKRDAARLNLDAHGLPSLNEDGPYDPTRAGGLFESLEEGTW